MSLTLIVHDRDAVPQSALVVAGVSAENIDSTVSLVGLGEGLDDWQPFDAAAYARGLFE